VLGVTFLPERAEENETLPRDTFATTGVAPLFVALCFSLPKSIAEGEAGVPLRVDLTWIFHFLPVEKVAFKSEAPLLPLLTLTLAPLALKDRAIFCSLSLPYLYWSGMVSPPFLLSLIEKCIPQVFYCQ